MEAFTCGVKANNSSEAELWGCFCGLQRAWNLDVRVCRLWTDVMEVMELVSINDYERHEIRDLIHEIKLLLSRN